LILIFRLTPPLSITQEEVHRAADIIIKVLRQAEAAYPNYTAPAEAKFNLLALTKQDIDRITIFRTSRRGDSNESAPEKHLGVSEALNLGNLDIENATQQIKEQFGYVEEVVVVSEGTQVNDTTNHTNESTKEGEPNSDEIILNKMI
jgi:hypothetical protein